MVGVGNKEFFFGRQKMTNLNISGIVEIKKRIEDYDLNEMDVEETLQWLKNKRENNKTESTLVPISKLKQWKYDQEKGIIKHEKGKDHFFTVEGTIIKHATGREVIEWDQPIFNQKEGGILVILCQEQEGDIRFLLHAKFEPGNIGKVQLAPTIQATHSNLNQHHSGKKPRFSEYYGSDKTTLIYKALHNEEGGRFWKKSNVNSLIILDKNEKLTIEKDDDYIWLSLGQIKKLMLCDNVVNPFVKTILSPL